MIQEALNVHTSPVETGRVRIRKRVHGRHEIVNPPLLHEEVVIERVLINQVVDRPISVRSEEETLIIPLLEEVFVIEKRLLKEEFTLPSGELKPIAPSG